MTSLFAKVRALVLGFFPSKPKKFLSVLPIITLALLVSFLYGTNQDFYSFIIFNVVGFASKQLTNLDQLLLLSASWSIFLCLMLSLRVNRGGMGLISALYSLIFVSLMFCILSTSVFAFFWFYEMLLLASAYLVLMSSPNKRSKKVALYFLFWTQAGSFILFCSVAFIAIKLNTSTFGDFFFLKTSKTIINYLSLTIFLAFGIKLPIWPFHFWLTKTHVEANTGFSIFLSGVLVKVAVLGLYKFSFFFFTGPLHLYTVVAVFGLVDSSIKLCLQQDLKKIIAIATVFEMNQLLCCMLFSSNTGVEVVNLFILFHTFISASFFYLVEVLYSATKSRTTSTTKNLLDKAQFLALALVIFVLFFIGLPMTPKFFIELVMFSKLLDLNIFVLFLVFASIFIFYAAFVRFFFVLLFGLSIKELSSVLPKKEWFFNFGFMALSLTLICFLF